MRREVQNPADIDAISDAWGDSVDKPAKIQRIEDLPNLEDVSGTEIEWVIPGILAQGALHMITSEPGAGKSTFAAAMAHAISNGLPFMGRATKQRPVLLLDAENPLPAIRERFKRLRIKTDQNFRVWGQWVGEDPPSVVDPFFWTRKRPFLRWWAALKIEESQCPKPARVTHPA